MLEGSYKNSIKDGRWTEWFENGQPEKQYSYRYGQKHGYWAEWHNNGLLAVEGSYVDGKKTAFGHIGTVMAKKKNLLITMMDGGMVNLRNGI